MLAAGTKAPSFRLPDQNGQIRTLEEFRGHKVLIYFYSKDNTSGCTKQAIGYSERIADYLKKGVTVIGVSKDTESSHKKFEEKQNLKITLLADPELAMINDYDVWKEKKMCGKTCMGVLRTTYLVDEEGIIIYASDKVKAAEDAEKMLEII